MTRGRGGVKIPPKNDDVIYEQPLIDLLQLFKCVSYNVVIIIIIVIVIIINIIIIVVVITINDNDLNCSGFDVSRASWEFPEGTCAGYNGEKTIKISGQQNTKKKPLSLLLSVYFMYAQN